MKNFFKLDEIIIIKKEGYTSRIQTEDIDSDLQDIQQRKFYWKNCFLLAAIERRS